MPKQRPSMRTRMRPVHPLHFSAHCRRACLWRLDPRCSSRPTAGKRAADAQYRPRFSAHGRSACCCCPAVRSPLKPVALLSLQASVLPASVHPAALLGRLVRILLAPFNPAVLLISLQVRVLPAPVCPSRLRVRALQAPFGLAAAQGHAGAQFALGFGHEHGQGAQQDKAKPSAGTSPPGPGPRRRPLQPRGHARRRQGVPRGDYAEAARCYCVAPGRGVASAMYAVFDMGVGCAKGLERPGTTRPHRLLSGCRNSG